MELNFTVETIITFSSFIMILTSNTLIYKLYRRYSNRFLLTFMLAWISYGTFWLLETTSYLFLSITLFVLSQVFLYIAFFLITIAFDFINYNRVNPVNVGILSAIASLAIYIGSDVETTFVTFTYPNGTQSLATSGNYRIAAALTGLYAGGVFLLNTYRILRLSDERNKTYAIMNFIGSIFFIVLVLIAYVSGLSLIIPGISELLASTGFLISSIALYKSPNLLFIIRYRTYRLSVIHDDTGLTLYTWLWRKPEQELQEDMYSSIFQGINSYSQYILDAGKPLEIRFEEGRLIIRYVEKAKLFFVLYTSSTSTILREGLRKFATVFVNKFQPKIDEIKEYNIVSQIFNDADQLIDDIFPFAP